MTGVIGWCSLTGRNHDGIDSGPGVFDEEEDNEADFDFGLQFYLDGVAAFIDRVCQSS